MTYSEHELEFTFAKNEAARQLDLDELVDKFADAKARKKS